LEHEADVVSGSDVNRARMADLDRRIGAALEALAQRQESVQTAQSQIDSLLRELRDVNYRADKATRELRRISAQLPPSAEEVDDMVSEARGLEREMTTLHAQQAAGEQEFAELLSAGERLVRDVSGAIADRFQKFARAFLSEKCDLQYTTELRKIGEEGARFPFPRFTVRMTSATMEAEKTPRNSPTQVSESQREFLDLAFRMALMDVAAAGRPAMLVIETPEASLDVLFVERAGRLLGDFALSGKAPGNRVVATSNLTGGEMIPALLGILPSQDGQNPRHYLAPGKREDHVINLLEVAAPNAAMLENGAAYRNSYRESVYPEGA
jgi:hypothetical protein